MRKADVDSPRQGIVPSLLTSGAILTATGLAATLLIAMHWNDVVIMVKGASAAAAGLTAAGGVALVGLLLIYASLKQSPSEAQ